MRQDYTDAMIEFSKVKFPVEIRITRKCAEVVAEYQPRYTNAGKIKKHIIWIHWWELLTDYRDIHTVIAHELIHAMQEEKRLTEIHGPFFRKWARKFRKEFDFLRDVFDPSVDK